MIPDPKWFEILKVSGWKTAALAAALGVFLWFQHTGLIEKLTDPFWSWFLPLSFLICLGLALASIGAALNNADSG